MITKNNLFQPLPTRTDEEAFQTLLETQGFRLERIVSEAHATPKGIWYDQNCPEWVLLMQGAAGLRIENQPEPITLFPGDYVYLPSHLKHRVEWTAPDQATVWLTLHEKSFSETS